MTNITWAVTQNELNYTTKEFESNFELEPIHLGRKGNRPVWHLAKGLISRPTL